MSLLPDRPRQSLFPSRSLHGRLAPADHHPRFGSNPSLRSKPYDKPLTAPMRTAPDSRWSHDLFEDDSNLYGPKVRYQMKGPDQISFGEAPRPSPSLRPFGNSVPTPASLPVSSLAKPISSTPAPLPIQPIVSQHLPTSIKKPQPAPIRSNSGISLLSRIQSSDTHKPLLSNDPSSSAILLRPSNNSTINTPPNFWKLSDPTLINRPDPSIHHSHPPPQEIRIQQSQAAKNHQAFDEAMAKYLNGPVILEVANLADGTSAEDVKTAFADFGEIQECSTEEGLRQANQPTLKARMIFTHKAEAEKAVEALNGALADGLTLAVKIVGRPTKKPERADFMTPSSPVDFKTLKSAADAAKKAEENHDVAMEDGDTGIVPTGCLRSEAVAQCDPRASIQVEPRPPAIYQLEHPKPAQSIKPNNLLMNRVQPLARPTSQPLLSSSSNRHHPAQSLFSAPRNSAFGKPLHSSHLNHSHNRNHHIHHSGSKSLLARIKPI
ncbi:hypothetical protein PGT21_036575 [Puccinia graminis f. sp. tritici]|uniref:RRM domain-containing protein n=2 Tax=Puccinia graminis f. sp. tritici TaxID=56615 RepID=E3L7Q2_PUCGT|nr:uncharacterized protein PGTG_18709 [Puccinia graminis f. sp. tritici CRL 75-36-700-3]EFP92577.1 hypothetical protein PGTG_18709 [Puccinia graminis f. sp. tritici CRL 75-36-700-3]KAA1119958.1 hypothetical protein PGT21_036575 [Puccinia graminis f. sp. tritici]